MKKNTLNICLGHLPFPATHAHHIDLMISPCLVVGAKRFALVEDKKFGPHGSALSEYAQLLWLYEHLDEVAAGYEFIRIFHYRRFVSVTSPTVGNQSENLVWATTISSEHLDAFEADFGRYSECEVYNTPAQFATGMLGQYALSHVLSDMLRFTDFLLKNRLMNSGEAVDFLHQSMLIPSCNIGVWRVDTYRLIFEILHNAAQFLYSQDFVNRPGYQRRSVGFLLERLNSYLLLKSMQIDPGRGVYGHNVVISDSPVVSHTA